MMVKDISRYERQNSVSSRTTGSPAKTIRRRRNESGGTTRQGCGARETTENADGDRSRRDCGASGWTWTNWPGIWTVRPSFRTTGPPSCRTRENGRRTKPECGESDLSVEYPVLQSTMLFLDIHADLPLRCTTLLILIS